MRVCEALLAPQTGVRPSAASCNVLGWWFSQIEVSHMPRCRERDCWSAPSSAGRRWSAKCRAFLHPRPRGCWLVVAMAWPDHNTVCLSDTYHSNTVLVTYARCCFPLDASHPGAQAISVARHGRLVGQGLNCCWIRQVGTPVVPATACCLVRLVSGSCCRVCQCY